MKGHKAKHHSHHRAEHAKGGHVEHGMKGVKVKDKAPTEIYSGKGSNVIREAEERKHGGKAKKHIPHLEGYKSEHRADRTPRKSGGRIGANATPLTTAAKGTPPKGRGPMAN